MFSGQFKDNREKDSRRRANPVDEARQPTSSSDFEKERTEQVFGREVSRRHALERKHSRLAAKYRPDRCKFGEVETESAMFNTMIYASGCCVSITMNQEHGRARRR